MLKEKEERNTNKTMIKIEDFKNSDLEINWKVINIGCLGSEKFFKELSYDDIVEFLIANFDEKNKEMIKVLSFSKNEYNEMGEEIKAIALKENSNSDIATMKWELVYVVKNMPSKNSDYMEGILKFYDIWAKFDFPEDSPFVIEGFNNISPENYYTLKNYILIHDTHTKWINERKKFIKNNN